MKLCRWAYVWFLICSLGGFAPQPTTVLGREQPSIEWRTSFDLGVKYAKEGYLFGSIILWTKTLESLENLPHTERDHAICQLNIARSLLLLGMNEEAIVRSQQALDLLARSESNVHERKIGYDLPRQRYGDVYFTFDDTRQQGSCHELMALAFSNLGQDEQAVLAFERALVLYRFRQGYEVEQAHCLMNMGESLKSLGRYEAAIERNEQALRLLRESGGSASDQAQCHLNVCGALLAKGDFEGGIMQHEQAMRLLQYLRTSGSAKPGCWIDLGYAYFQLGRLNEAIIAFQHAPPSWNRFRGLGLAYQQRGQPEDSSYALDSLMWAVEGAEKLFGSALASEHKRSLFERPSVVFSDMTRLLCEIGTRHEQINDPRFVRWGVVAEDIAFHFADRGKGRALVDLLREKAALETVRPDTKLLVEDRELSLRISKLTVLREGLSVAEVERHQKLMQDIENLQQRRNMIEVELKRTTLGDYVAPEFRKPMEMAKELEPNTAVLQYSIGEKESWLLVLMQKGATAHRLGVQTPALPELLSRQQATLEQLVEAWKKRPEKIGLDGLVKLARARVEDLGEKPKERHNLINVRQEQRIIDKLGEVVLPDSALTELRQKSIQHLLVIPNGSLHYVPLAMLRVKDSAGTAKQFLIEEFAISYTPAMTTLDTIRKQKQDRQKKRKLPRRSLLAFANPDFEQALIPSTDDMVTRLRSFRSGYYSDKGLRLTVLPETEKEAVRVASLFAPAKLYAEPTLKMPEGKAVVYTHQGTSEAQVKQLLSPPKGGELKPQWQYLLFSTHGLADTHNGMLSCIVLSSPSAKSKEDGFLQAQEVMNLELDADLVMLSACQTGLGRMRGGEGLVGLSAAFFYAGSESVCASLWRVPTGPTGQLVTEFFKNLKEGKADKANALRQAQLKVMRQGRNPDGKTSDYSSPFCWAAFTLIGDWR